MPSSLTLSAALALPLIRLAAAHGYVSGVEVNGGAFIEGCNPNWNYMSEDQQAVTPGWKALNQDNGFVSPDAYDTSDIACHKSATPGQDYIDASAGDTLTVYWNTWPDTHQGPVLNYLAECSGECTEATAGDLTFTKISAAGLISGQEWATDDLIAANFSSTVTLPAALAPGNYVLRHEIIALHSAGSENGAQNYPQCLNLKVADGGGSTALPAGEPATDLYTPTDPGILFDLYSGYTSYDIPGPAVWEP
ncbi:lytic polysaccharide monooxygenase [Xylariomycetidae sp. FL0641]|nr:lytic polysaccharide monooxygenase [Xylariomycetidae sp. FL0641]